MTRAVEELYEKAAGLPLDERTELIGLLLENIDGETEDGVEEAWAAEIERRMADYRAGRMKTVSWSELRAHLHRPDR